MSWLLSVINNSARFHETTDWISNTDVTRWLLIERWFLNLSRIFIDLGSDFGKAFTYITLIILLGYSVYFLCRICPQRVWLFVLTLIGSTALTLMLPDIISKGVRSIVPRYLFPCYLGFQLAVAYLLATKITAVNLRKRRLWQSLMAVLLSSGIISCIISSCEGIWPINDKLSLSHLLASQVRFQLVNPPNMPQIYHGFSDVFLLNLSPETYRKELL